MYCNQDEALSHINWKDEVRFHSGLDSLILFSKPLRRKAVDSTMVRTSIRLRDLGTEIFPGLTPDDDQCPTRFSLWNDQSALFENMQSFEMHMNNIKDKMLSSQFLQIGANVRLLEGKRAAIYETLFRLLDESVHFQSYLHGIDGQILWEGEQHLIVIYKASIFRTICRPHICIAALDLRSLHLVLADFILTSCMCGVSIVWGHKTSTMLNIESTLGFTWRWHSSTTVCTIHGILQHIFLGNRLRPNNWSRKFNPPLFHRKRKGLIRKLDPDNIIGIALCKFRDRDEDVQVQGGTSA